MSLEDLKLDSEEFEQLLQIAKRSRVKNALIAAKSEVDREIVNLEVMERAVANRLAGNTIEPKKYVAELTEYAWDQSDKFVKLFVTVVGVQNIDEKTVTLILTPNSMRLNVDELDGKDYVLTINNLLEQIDVEKSYRKIKNDVVSIYLKKVKECKRWSHLTSIEQRLNEKKDAKLKSDTENPEKALINIMKKMYNEGDSKTKEMIAKALTESQKNAYGGSSNGM